MLITRLINASHAPTKQNQTNTASHFRFGTISWAKTSTGAAGEVEFSMRLAYRRNYNWGSYFGEQWLQTTTDPTTQVFYGSEETFASNPLSAANFAAGFVDSNLATTRNCATKQGSLLAQDCFQCPSPNGGGPAPNCDDKAATDLAGGCVSPQGCRNNNPKLGGVDKFYIKFPPVKHTANCANGQKCDVVACPTPFYCDYKVAVESNGVLPQFTSGVNPAAAKCAQWHLPVLHEREADHPGIQGPAHTAGLGVDTLSHAGLSDGIAYWDDVSVMAYDDNIGVSAGALGDDVAALNVISQRVWETLSTTASPPPRYEHSTCHPKHIGNRHTNDVTSDYMVIFGGERSSYLYNDVWALSTKSVGGVRTATWEFLPHLSKEVPSPRMGHSAVVYESDAVVNAQGKNELPAGSKMIVYGGRDHTGNLGDVWSYDLQSRIWTKLAASTPLGARFGHSAAMFGSTMYVMGGYTSTGFSGEFFKADIACKMPSYTGTYVSATAKGCNVTVTDITTGCMNAAGPSSVSLTPRFAQGAIADSTSVYFTGGTDFSSEPGSFGQVYRFKVATCEWDTVIVNGEEARSEMSLGAFGTGIYVQGGTSPDGSFASNVQYMPLSD
ncbi:leucine-zipper-like transcriptional regulator 1 [Pycnococcus provasolii]|uniref:Leucine-zipper-like transcriptional regulator 1 n=1 Tax=Pycnococcus provasolii TaxID=41880 RepID=A0A830HB06_9CHLO|nr:leucine-zipper-like transcriptional regulator 1 [Pycnococcus provasolii]